MPAPGASLKGVQAYLSRWGLAQPKPRTLHSQAAEQLRTQEEVNKKQSSDLQLKNAEVHALNEVVYKKDEEIQSLKGEAV
mgnify:CR=1 FL=1